MEPLYDYPLYRPPSEADSLIFQVTLGCSFNKCSFCNMYRTKKYAERPIEEIIAEINMTSKAFPATRRIFLADGDAMNLQTEKIIKILETLYSKFSNLERVSAYAMPKNLVQKSNDELARLRKAGLGMVYLGIESGSDIILKKVTKGASSSMIIDACNKAKKNDMMLSCMIILGLGGKRYTKEHISGTIKVVNAISPDYLAALTLYLEDGVRNEFMTKFGETFDHLDDHEVLHEIEMLVSGISTSCPVIFRANHASNVYSIGGTLPVDKEKILALVEKLQSHPEMLKPKVLRRF